MSAKKRIWAKGLLWLFVVMLFFTFVSRIAAALTVAQVRTGHCSSRKIRHAVTVEGRVEKNRELSVVSEPDIGVKAVFVSVGQQVKKGEVLAQLDMGDLKEKFADAKGKKRKLYAKLKEKKGRIYAAADGVVTELLVNVGQKTQDGGILTMTDDRSGFLFVGTMNPDGAAYVSQGDKITLSLSGREIKNLRVTSLVLDESGEFIRVSVLLPAKSASIGEPASISVEKDSDNYSCTVPITAVFRESGKSFVLLAESRDTVLGEQQIAVKKEVAVLEENENFAALEEGALDKDSLIILDTDRYVEAGDTVRLIEE